MSARAIAPKAPRQSRSRPEDGAKATAKKRAGSATTGDTTGAADLARRVGRRVRDERSARRLSLDDLSRASGVSRAALSQIETQKSSPSLSVMWKIATGLGIPFSELLGEVTAEGTFLRRDDAQVLRSRDGRFESRPVTPTGATPWVEVYEILLAARSAQHSESHAPGTREVVVVLSGHLRVTIGKSTFDLEAGDSLAFRADQPHSYENPSGSETRAHDVITYTRT